MAIQTVIAEILKKRHQKVPMLEQAKRELDELAQQLDALRSMANDTVEAENVPDDFREVTANVANQVSNLQQDIMELLPKFTNITERFRKKTINIGVAGNARQGKSTVLQHISGLTDQEIPTSDKLPCTGAKSKIHHFEGDPYAHIEFYSADEFFRDIISPYFQDFQRLNFPRVYSLSEFEKPLPQLNLAQSSEPVSDEAKYKKLAEIHQAFPTFKHVLSTEKTIPLAEIREYVTQEKKLYLAVKTAYIYTRFPNHDVSGLCFVDLPGMEAAQYHEQKLAVSLKQEVDAVIFLKRPDPSGDQWQKADYAVLNMIASSAPEIELSNWLFIVLNEMESPSNAHLLPLLKDDAPNTARQSNMLVSNCKRSEGSESVFETVLRHLEQNLEKIDRVLLDSLTRSVEQITSKVMLNLSPMMSFFNADQNDLGAHKEFNRLFKKFYTDFANTLEPLVEEVRGRTYLDHNQQNFLATVKTICDEAEQNPPVPSAEEVAKFYYPGSGWYGGAVASWLTILRAKLAQRLAKGIDVFLEGMIENVYQDILVRTIPETLRALVVSQETTLTAREQMKAFYELLDQREHPKLREAFEYIFRFNFSYQSHFHYRVRQQMRSLDPLMDTSLVPSLIPSDAHKKHAPDIQRGLATMYCQAVAKIRKQFITEMQADPGNAIFALVEEIRDRLLRTEGIEDEWDSFLFLHCGEVWPQQFKQFAEQKALRKQWQGAVDSVLTLCRKLQQVFRQ